MKVIKHIFLVLVTLTLSVNGFSQKYMDDIAKQACECFENVPDSLNSEQFSMELGLCMIDVASPYRKQLKKDYNIDFDNIDTQGAELGRLIGMRMVSFCPNALVKMASKVNSEKGISESSEEEVAEMVYVGKITKIENSQFVVFTVKNAAGKYSKFYWLTFTESNLELSTDYMSFTDKSVIISYTTQEFFDARIGEYKMFNILQKIEASGD